MYYSHTEKTMCFHEQNQKLYLKLLKTPKFVWKKYMQKD